MIIKLESSRMLKEEGLRPNYDWKEVEDRVRRFVSEIDLIERVRRSLSKKKRLGYVEGPPTLNNEPHMGHIRGRVMKDLWYRYNTLLGKNIVFRAGWDTQGLPVELQAEKELGLTGNKWENLKKVGEERLVEACKELIYKYQKYWVEADNLLGLLLDHKRAYMTYKDEYIEREWRYLEVAWKRGLLGEGYKVVPYCPSCQTSLSHAEIALGGYEKLEDPSIYYKVRLEDGSFLAVWTTMPFTIITDELVAVKPDAEYQYVMVGDERWVICSDRKGALEQELGIRFGEVIKSVRGSELEGLRYQHPFLDLIPALKGLSENYPIHRVVAEDFVDTSTGTGIVHLSPANGEEDYNVAVKRGIPIFAPFDDQVCFKEEAGRFAGYFARDADRLVSEALKERGALIFEGRIIHDYPICWRSGHRIVWLVRREYFYWVDRIKDKLIKAAEKVEYFFESPRNRFLEFINESPPWCITRERVWGAPLPIWVCSSCGEKIPAFSRKRIIELAESLPDGPNFELHRPWIDRVVLRCPKCKSRAYREPFVLDTWHNSGSSPLASFTDKEYRRLVPVEFLTEGIDQTRGWAYTLLVLNVILTNKAVAPYKAFLFQGHVLDEQGRKMSKSLGNVILGLDVLRNYSVDLTRFYLLWKSSPIDQLILDLKEMSGRPYQVLNTLYHLHLFLKQNGDVDAYDPTRHKITWAAEKGLLKDTEFWLLAKLEKAEDDIHDAYRGARYNDVCKILEELIIEIISQGYVRMIRPELWRESPKERDRRIAIYSVLGYALQRIDLLMHPIAPYLTEYLYQEVFMKGKWKVPILLIGLRRNAGLIIKKESEGIIDLSLLVENGCNSARMKAQLKRRWPLSRLYLLIDEERFGIAERAKGMIASLCNVKEVILTKEARAFPAEFKLIPSVSRIGSLFKERTAEVLRSIKKLEGSDAIAHIWSGKPLSVKLSSGYVELPLSAFELEIKPSEGYEVSEREGIFIAIEKRRDEKLVSEGLVRDVARRLQSLRKIRGYSPTSILEVASIAGLEDEELKMLEPYKGELSFLVRVKNVRLLKEKDMEGNWYQDELDGRLIFLDVH